MKQNKSQCFFCFPYNHQVHALIEDRILNNEFNSTKTWGFIVHSRRRNILLAEYVEKKVFSEKIVDPFGNSTQIDRVSYQQIYFQLSIASPNILIFHPPTSYRKLTNQLAQFSDYTISVESKNVKVLDWIDALAKSGLYGTISKISVDPIKYDNLTHGKLILIGKHDIRNKVETLLSTTKFNIKSAKVNFSTPESFPDVELTTNGKIIFSRPIDLDKFKIFYDSYISVLEDHTLDR